MKFLNNLKRCSVDIFLVLFFLSVIFMFPAEYLDPRAINPKVAFLATIFAKGLNISIGFLHAQVSRKIAFPYIKFEAETSWSNNALIIVLYASFIMGWAIGG